MYMFISLQNENAYMHVPCITYWWNQRTACRNQLSPTKWVSGIELWSFGLAASLIIEPSRLLLLVSPINIREGKRMVKKNDAGPRV